MPHRGLQHVEAVEHLIDVFRANVLLRFAKQRAAIFDRPRSTLEAEMATGTVKWFNPTKGYGFIQPSGGGGGRDVFVHISAVEQAGLRSLNEGQTVEYEIESNRGKESATRLKVK